MTHREQSENFRHRVRERDSHCVITRTRNSRFVGLEAAHIFPVAHRDVVLGRSLHGMLILIRLYSGV